MNDFVKRLDSSLNEIAVISTPVRELDKRYAESEDKFNEMLEKVESLIPNEKTLTRDLSDSVTAIEADLQVFTYKRGFWEGMRFMARISSIYELNREG